MERLYQLLALILLLATSASGQVVTTDVANMANRAWSITAGQPWYVRVVAVQGVTPINLTDRRVLWTIRHINTEALIVNSTGTIHDAEAGEVIFRWTPTAAGTYSSVASILRTDTSEVIAQLVDDTHIVLSKNATGTAANVRLTYNMQSAFAALTFAGQGELKLGAGAHTLDVSAVKANGVSLAPLLPTLPPPTCSSPSTARTRPRPTWSSTATAPTCPCRSCVSG